MGKIYLQKAAKIIGTDIDQVERKAKQQSKSQHIENEKTD